MATAAPHYDITSIPPRYIVEGYRQAYQRLHNCEPQCRYIGNHWFNVNGETVHRLSLVDEIVRLRSQLRQPPKPAKPGVDKSVIQRLIAKLRSF